MIRRRIVGLAAALALTVSSMATQTAEDAAESCFAAHVRAERLAVGVKPLSSSDEMSMIARAHSTEMARAGTIYHNPQLREQAGSYRYLGENVGMGPDCDVIHTAFMSSRPHRENILDPDYTELGVGVAYDSERTLYVTEVFRAPPKSPQPAQSATPKERC